MTRNCPICGSSTVEILGPILHPRPAFVGGVEIDLGDTQFRLLGCRECEFQYKDPPISSDKLLACYARSTSSNWEVSPDPRLRRFDQLRSILESHRKGGKILDIGCSNGALLSYLGDQWRRFGVEPSLDAASMARQRNVNVLATGLEDLDQSQGKFDAILAIDVIEHIVDPMPFFRLTAARLETNGVFLVLTGNTSATSWRMQGSRYWYCSLPEHVSFYNRKSLNFVSKMIGLEGVDYRELCHKRMSIWRWCSDHVKSLLYVAGNRAKGFGVSSLQKRFVDRRGPSIESARDHLIYVFRKPASEDGKVPVAAGDLQAASDRGTA
jgi:SAM-dependent methyltransferase